MSKPDCDQGRPPTDEGATAETRIDAAHVLIKAQAEPVPVDQHSRQEQPLQKVSTAGANAPGSASPAQQLRVQAAQLAEYLRHRQKHLDRRESQLHAQIAHLEQEARAARMSLSERATLRMASLMRDPVRYCSRAWTVTTLGMPKMLGIPWFTASAR